MPTTKNSKKLKGDKHFNLLVTQETHEQIKAAAKATSMYMTEFIIYSAKEKALAVLADEVERREFMPPGLKRR